MPDMKNSELLKKTQAFVERAVKGEFLEIMETYYDDNEYVQIEGDGKTFNSKKDSIEFIKGLLGQTAKYHGGTVRSVGLVSDDGNGNGTTTAEYTFKTELKDGTINDVKEVQMMTWKNGKVVKSKYYCSET